MSSAIITPTTSTDCRPSRITAQASSSRRQRATEYREDEETSGERADQRLDQRRQALAPWVDENTRVVPPDITFDKQATLYLGGKRFVLIYAGPAHSASDSMMMVEPDGVLFAGDVVQNGRIPFMNADDVDTANWLRSLAEVEKLAPKFIIPGHGRPSANAKDAIAFTRDYISFVRAAMAKAAAKIGSISTRPTTGPTGRSTRTCRHSTPTTAAMPTGFFWKWRRPNSRLTSRSIE